ncbi:Vps13c [Symbiodinium natans]|uniref:Vps13c protein n=1 Tax=Symbiodinium natans TaxID=878477 RepID=A0A812K0W3_9DINO|nr:Vps13c [Symbiodinium natans]
MLESALENILLQYLDSLHLGVFSGSLELDNLKVRPDALAILGFPGFRVHAGSIDRISLSIPWTRLYTGKVRAIIKCMRLEIESLAESCHGKSEEELIKEMRAAKEKAIDVQMQYLQDLIDRSKDSEDENAVSDNASLGMNLARKIINNITVVLEDVHIAFMNSQRGLACCMDLPNLAILSTDKTFREREDAEGAVVPGQSMYKTLQMKDFSVQMSPAGTKDLQEAAYVLSPVSANLQLAHEPANNILKIKLMVATEELAEVFLRRSQVKHLRSIKSDLNEEARKFHLMLVPEADQKEINQDAGDSTDEYSKLYERSIAEAWQIMSPDLEPLSPADERRKQLLEDALSARLLARARWKVERKAEVLNEEVVRRKREQEESRVAEQRKKNGILGRLWGRQESEVEVEEPETALLSAEEKDQLLTDLKDVSKVEQVDVPKKFSFEFVLGQMALDLIDDQHSDEVRRQLMSLALREAGIKLDINMATDFRGRDSAEWGVKIDLKSFHALHQTRAFMQLKSAGSAGSQWLSQGCSAASFDIQSKLQKEQNLLKVSFEFMPVEIHLLEGIVEMVLDFWREPTRAENMEIAPEPQEEEEDAEEVHEGMEMAKDWLEANAKQAKQLAQAAYDRIPDKIQIENFGRPGGKVLRAVSARAGGLEMTLDAPVWISGARMKTAGWVFIRLGDVVTIHAAGAGAGESISQQPRIMIASPILHVPVKGPLCTH